MDLTPEHQIPKLLQILTVCYSPNSISLLARVAPTMRSYSEVISITIFVLLSLTSSTFSARISRERAPPGTPGPLSDPDPEMLQHLRQLFLGAKQLGRPLVNGEMNLLPDRTKGFANSVKCFSDISATSLVVDNFRVLQFNLSSLSTSESIVAVDLVLKQPSDVPSFKTQLHEIVGDSALKRDLKLLDSGEWEGQWHTLRVEDMEDFIDSTSRKRNYRLALSISSSQEDEEDLLMIMKPMLLVYTNSLNQTSENLGTMSPPSLGRNNMGASRREKESRQQGSAIRRRRSISSSQPQGSTSAAEPTLEELAALPCQKNIRTMTFTELGWPGSFNEVLVPSVAQFSFCHGRCNLPSHEDYQHQYTNHAKVIAISRADLVGAGIAPCCVPVEYNPIEVSYRNIYTGVIVMTSLPDITSCQCL